MALANPAAKFASKTHIARPFERRSVCVLPASMCQDHRNVKVTKCDGAHTHFTRSKVVDAVARGEMRWVDHFHNVATFTPVAAGTWQKKRSGPVATMQMIAGGKGRYVPSNQRDSSWGSA